MPFISMATSELRDLNFYPGAGNQWYRDNSRGNGDSGDNHTHLRGRAWTQGYDPTRPNAGVDMLEVQDIELKIRCVDRPIVRVWLVRMLEGDFKLPIFTGIHGITAEEREIARALYDVLPSRLQAE